MIKDEKEITLDLDLPVCVLSVCFSAIANSVMKTLRKVVSVKPGCVLGQKPAGISRVPRLIMCLHVSPWGDRGRFLCGIVKAL